MHGTTQTVGISSNPSSANVTINGCAVGKTPVSVNLKRNQNHQIKLELPGYQPYEIVCTRQVSGFVFGNIIFGGVIGLAVDAISGGIYRLTPEQIQAELHENQMNVVKRGSNSYVAIVMKPKPSWEKIGQLQKVAN